MMYWYVKLCLKDSLDRVCTPNSMEYWTESVLVEVRNQMNFQMFKKQSGFQKIKL